MEQIPEPRTDLELIESIKYDSDSESLKELSNRHSDLYYKVTHKYLDTLTASGHSFSDVERERDYVVYTSVLNYDPSKNSKYSTWLANWTRYQFLHKINNEDRFFPIDDNQIKFYHDELSSNPKTEEYGADMEYILGILGQLSDKRILEIYKKRYFDGGIKTWVDIGKELGVTAQTALTLHNKALDLIKEKMTSQEIFDGV